MSSTSQKLCLSHRANGRYLLGKLAPPMVPILGSKENEIWPEHGDPMSIELCAFAAERLLGRRLDPLTTIQVIVTVTEVPGPARTFT